MITARLDHAQAKLKTLQPNVASVDEVKSALQWSKVTMMTTDDH